MTNRERARRRPVDHGLRPEQWDAPVDQLGIKDAQSIRAALSNHGVSLELLDRAYEHVSPLLAWYRHQRMHAVEFPTAAAERDSVRLFVERAEALQQAWGFLPHSTKKNIGAADRNAFDEFEGKLEDVLDRARALLGTLLQREEIDPASGAIIIRDRTPNENKGRPPVTSKLEVLERLCIAWLLYTQSGSRSLMRGEWLRGSKASAAKFANHLFYMEIGRASCRERV